MIANETGVDARYRNLSGEPHGLQRADGALGCGVVGGQNSLHVVVGRREDRVHLRVGLCCIPARSPDVPDHQASLGVEQRLEHAHVSGMFGDRKRVGWVAGDDGNRVAGLCVGNHVIGQRNADRIGIGADHIGDRTARDVTGIGDDVGVGRLGSHRDLARLRSVAPWVNAAFAWLS